MRCWGFSSFPAVLEAQVPKLIEKHTGGAATLEKVEFNPFTLQLVATDFSMADDPSGIFLKFSRLAANFQLLDSILKRAIVFDEITLVQPYGKIVKYQKGRFNFSSLIDSKPAEKEPRKKPPAISIAHFELKNGSLDFIDRSGKEVFKETITPLSLSIRNFSTLQQSTDAPLTVETQLASGGKLRWRGDINMVPVRSRGHIEISDVRLPKVWQLIRSKVNFRLTKGRAGATLDYDFQVGGRSPDLKVKGGAVRIQALTLTPKGSGREVVHIPVVELKGIDFDLAARTVTLKEIASQGAALATTLSKDGRLDLAGLFSPVEAAKRENGAGEKEGAGNAGTWAVTIGRTRLEGYGVRFSDLSRGRPVQVKLHPVDITMTHLSTASGSSAELQARIGVCERGKITARGEVSIRPVRADIRFEGKDLDIRAYQPYIDDFVRLKLNRGAVDADGHLLFERVEGSAPSLKYTGNVLVKSLHTSDLVERQDFLNWSALRINGIEYNLDPMKLDIDEIVSDGLFVRVVIEKDRSTNLSSIFKLPTKKQARKEIEKLIKKPSPEKSRKLPVSIGSIRINGASSRFADLSLVIPFAVDINELNGWVDGFTSESQRKTKALIKGKVDKISPVVIKGELYPLRLDHDTDVFLQFRNVNLTTATPYMAQFAGYKVEKGRISLDLHYKVRKRKLFAENKLVIEQLTLGERVESPDAVDAPVKLAVALLKDASGVIELELPVQGNLDDPKFNFAALMGKTLLNVVYKVAASPFTLLASLVGAKDDLSYVGFPSGGKVLTAEERKKLDLLGKALKARPQLQLEIKGAAYKEYDWPGIAKALLRRQLHQIEEKREKSGGERSPEEYRQLLHELYKQKFPQSADTFESARDSEDPSVVEGYYRMIEQKLIATIPYDSSLLHHLAKRRAQTVAKYLIDHEFITPNRVYLLELSIEDKTPPEGAVTRLNVKPM